MQQGTEASDSENNFQKIESTRKEDSNFRKEIAR